MNLFRNIWRALVLWQNRRRRSAWRNTRVIYTWGSGPQFRDERDSLSMFKRIHQR